MTTIVHVYEVKAVLLCPTCGGIMLHTVRVGGTPMDPHVPEPVTPDPDPNEYITPTDPDEAFVRGLQRSLMKAFPGAMVSGPVSHMRHLRNSEGGESQEWNFELTREEWEALGRPHLFDRLTRTVEVMKG